MKPKPIDPAKREAIADRLKRGGYDFYIEDDISRLLAAEQYERERSQPGPVESETGITPPLPAPLTKERRDQILHWMVRDLVATPLYWFVMDALGAEQYWREVVRDHHCANERGECEWCDGSFCVPGCPYAKAQEST